MDETTYILPCQLSNYLFMKLFFNISFDYELLNITTTSGTKFGFNGELLLLV
jgi:hypothetical protein